MLLDKQNLFSEAQPLVQSTGSFPSNNIVDLGVARNIGGSTKPNVEIVIQVVTTYLASGGASTLQVDIQTAPDDGTGAPGSWVTLQTLGPIAKASLVQGYKFGANFLPDVTQRFVRLNYTIATNAGTAGAITAGLVASGEYQASYPRGYVA